MQIDIAKIPELLALLGAAESKPAAAGSPADHLVGSYVIVRSRDSGVHAGFLQACAGRHVSLTNARRLWFWKAAKGHTLSAVSLYGVGGGSKITDAVGCIEILDACEIIPTTGPARESIMGAESHDPS